MNKSFVSPALMWLIVIFGVALIPWLVPAEAILTPSTLTYVLVISAVFYWMYFFSLSIYFNRQAHLSADKTEKLIQHGIYGVVRHPIYFSDIVLAWGIFLFWPRLSVLVSVAWLTLIMFYWMRLEEKVLTEKFGNDYEEYKKKVPMFLPRMFKQ